MKKFVVLALTLVGGLRLASAWPLPPADSTTPAEPTPADLSDPQPPPPPAADTTVVVPVPAEPLTNPDYEVVEADVHDSMTTNTWRPARTFDLHWRLLYLPQHLLELAFSPIGLLVAATEKYRLDRRVVDWLGFDKNRYVIRPRIKFAFNDGPGLGARFSRKKLFAHRAELSLAAMYRTSNRDWQIDLEYEHRLLLLGGRGIRAHATAELDQNQPFYGIGGATELEDRRVLTSRDQAVAAEVDLRHTDRYTYSGILEVAFRRQTLEAGVDKVRMPVGTPGDSVLPPPGFDETSHYADLRVVGSYDTRDTEARATRGWLVSLGTLARFEVTGAERSAATFTGNARLHLPLVGELRTLMIAVGGAASIPLFRGHSVPLYSLAGLGRHNVRGYDRSRFYDRFAFTATVEYRFPLYEYLSSKVGLDALLFVDTGTSFGEEKPLPGDWVRYSAGIGLRGAHETKLLFQMFFALSPEGAQVVFGAEKQL